MSLDGRDAKKSHSLGPGWQPFVPNWLFQAKSVIFHLLEWGFEARSMHQLRSPGPWSEEREMGYLPKTRRFRMTGPAVNSFTLQFHFIVPSLSSRHQKISERLGRKVAGKEDKLH